MTSNAIVLEPLDGADASKGGPSARPDRSPAATLKKGVREVRAFARTSVSKLRRHVTGAALGALALTGAAHAEPTDARHYDGSGVPALQVADAGTSAVSGNVVMSDAGPAFAMPTVAKQADGSYRQVSDVPIVVAAKPADTVPTLTPQEIAEIDPERIDYNKFIAFSPMITQRTGLITYTNVRERERVVDPISTRDQLGSLVDGARDMPTESVKTILGGKTDKITAANLADFLDCLTDPDTYPQIVSWRAIARKDATGDFVKGPDGKVVFDPIFEPSSTKARPGMEAAAKKIVDDITRQRTNLVTGRIRAGQVDAATLDRWAAGIDAAARMMPPEIVGRETLRRVAINGVIGIDFVAQDYAKRGRESLVGSTKDDPESGRKIYVPSKAAQRLLSSGVETARLLQAKEPGKEYFSRAVTGDRVESVKVGDLGKGDGLQIIKKITGTSNEFWNAVDIMAIYEAAIDVATNQVVKNPRVLALIQSETVESMRQYAPQLDRELNRQTYRARAVNEAAKRAMGTPDLERLTRASMQLEAAGVADGAVASLYWQRAWEDLRRRGIDPEVAFKDGRDPLGDMGGMDGDSIRDILVGKKNPAKPATWTQTAERA